MNQFILFCPRFALSLLNQQTTKIDMMKRTRTLMLLFALLMTATKLTAQAPTQKDADAKYATNLLPAGTAAPDFSLKTPEGKLFKFSKMKGKYVVIDFWASWCPDCRKDAHNLVRMYDEFHRRGVEFIGVSFDTDVNAWTDGIDLYHIPYMQVSELKKFHDTDISKAYGVKWIPSMYLIGKDGKVILGTVLSDKLEKTLTELTAVKKTIEGTTESLVIRGSKGKLAAVTQKPVLREGARCPMAIVMHGFSGNKEEPMLQLICDSLQANGIASIRFDFNGHGASEGEFKDMTVPNEIEDALKVYEYVKSLPYVSTVMMVGHSQGGVVASMAAGKLGDKISKVVLLAPAAVLRDDAIRGNTMVARYDPLDPPEYVTLWDGLKLGREYIKTAFTLPIYETAAGYHGAACIIHGTGDRVVPYTYGERYHDLWKGSEFYLLDGFDHGFSQNVYRVVDLTTKFLIK
jgi:pimeloyl-ACP methyl ester carboxylesterase/peroxiredoxin